MKKKMEVKTKSQSTVRPDIFLTANDFKSFGYPSLNLVNYFRFFLKMYNYTFFYMEKN